MIKKEFAKRNPGPFQGEPTYKGVLTQSNVIRSIQIIYIHINLD